MDSFDDWDILSPPSAPHSDDERDTVVVQHGAKDNNNNFGDVLEPRRASSVALNAGHPHRVFRRIFRPRRLQLRRRRRRRVRRPRRGRHLEVPAQALLLLLLRCATTTAQRHGRARRRRPVAQARRGIAHRGRLPSGIRPRRPARRRQTRLQRKAQPPRRRRWDLHKHGRGESRG